MRIHAKARSAGSAEPAAVSTQGSGIRRGLFGLVCLCVLGLAAFLGSGAPSAGPTPAEACSTGLDLTIRLPAADGVDVLEPSQMRDIRIELPEGLAINTSSADGLETCSVEQVHFGERVDSECPDAAKLGETEFDVPALPRKMRGAIYLREPRPGNLFRIWVVADDQGVHVKLPGQLVVDEATGQIDSVVLDVPQIPVREVKLLLKSGFRAPLVNPPTCGTYQTTYEFTPWSGNPPVKGKTPMTIDQGCNTGGFDPKLSAGTTNPAGGQSSPFVFTLTRQDGEQNPASLDIAMPPGLSAKLAGIPLCEGAAADAGACPADSRIGHVIAATGAGPAPLWVPQAGKDPTAVYLGAPYKGAPLSAIAVVPAQAGPFDLGDVVVRSAIYVDPQSAQVTIKSDPLPQIIQGIPISYRALSVHLDRADFTLNPTSCDPMSVDATVTGTGGASANVSDRFQVGECAGLAFAPKIAMAFTNRSQMHKRKKPGLDFKLSQKSGEANIKSVTVKLPRALVLDVNGASGALCEVARAESGDCPASSIVGHATAVTPLLDQPRTGNVYFVRGDNALPNIMVALRGQISINLRSKSKVDKMGRLISTFAAVPDAPISQFHLTLGSAGHGVLSVAPEPRALPQD